VFGRSAKKLSEELEKANIRTRVNPEKPGKGNFVVTVSVKNSKSTEVVGLRGMPRPFKALRELDIGAVAESISKLHK
jgi:hypothetical protein